MAEKTLYDDDDVAAEDGVSAAVGVVCANDHRTWKTITLRRKKRLENVVRTADMVEV